MQRIKVKIPERLLSEITAEDAQNVKRRLDAHSLSITWLKARLEEEYGIEFKSRSNLPDLLAGRWSISNNKHNNGRKIIFCAREILDRYESIFSIRKDDTKNEKS